MNTDRITLLRRSMAPAEPDVGRLAHLRPAAKDAKWATNPAAVFKSVTYEDARCVFCSTMQDRA